MQLNASSIIAHWPPGLPKRLTLPATSLVTHADIAAHRFPRKPFILFYGRAITFADFHAQVERVAGFLQHVCGVQDGDRVMICMQNCPQWIIAYYAILRANAVVVPVNPMNKTEELGHLVQDSGARVAVAAQELTPQFRPLLHPADASGQTGLSHLIVTAYADFLDDESLKRPLPSWLTSRLCLEALPGLHAWGDAMDQRLLPGPHTREPDDLCVLPYTSGTTGQPKGCMHTHRSVMATAVGGMQWFNRTQDSVLLSVLPFFHVTGMTSGMNGPLYVGATIVLMARWDRELAAQLIETHRVTHWQAIAAMVVDFLAHPAIDQFHLSSLQGIRGGGAPMPKAVAQRLKTLTGLDYVEGYGMTETMAATHINPPHRPKPQCLGIPVFDVDARLVNPDTLVEVEPGHPGEIVVHGPQVMQGYWQQPSATEEAFITLDGKRFLRTGDLARRDEEGYFFMVDRLKRMINASGYKVWPAEVEAMLYHHPAVHEVCVMGAKDPIRGETVKAVVILRPEWRDRITPQALIDWAIGHMAAYKAPRLVAFVDDLPRSGSGKILWRELQEQQNRLDSPT
jgi:fatty-acyl-CoA synthase